MKGSNRLKHGWVASILPGAAWEFVFLLVPFGIVAVISFLSRGEYGDVERPWTWENYKRLAGFGLFGFEWLYPAIILRSFLLALCTAVLCGLASLPLAFFVAARTHGKRMLALLLLTIPVWTNLLVRTFGWQMLLGPEGWVTGLAVWLGWIEPGRALYPGTGAVLICLVCDYLPFAALPIYAAVEKMDWAQVEAAQDLGVQGWGTFRHSIYPQIRAGIWAGLLLVFLPATGQFVIPDLLGGAKTVLIGNVLQQQFGGSRDWPFGAAFTVVSMLILLAGTMLYSAKTKQQSQ